MKTIKQEILETIDRRKNFKSEPKHTDNMTVDQVFDYIMFDICKSPFAGAAIRHIVKEFYGVDLSQYSEQEDTTE